MIPVEVANIATLIWSGWPELDENNKDDREALRSIFDSARRIYDAGYRKPVMVEASPTVLSNGERDSE